MAISHKKEHLKIEAYIENTYFSDTGNISSVDLESINSAHWSTWFNIWLETLKDHLPIAKGYELSLRFTNDIQIQEFNRQYRHQDKSTDVLAFASLESDLPEIDNDRELLYIGDILVSLDTAKIQATDRDTSLLKEVAWLTTHGLLHLLGWDHPDRSSLVEMLDLQAYLLRKINLTEYKC